MALQQIKLYQRKNLHQPVNRGATTKNSFFERKLDIVLPLFHDKPEKVTLQIQDAFGAAYKKLISQNNINFYNTSVSSKRQILHRAKQNRSGLQI